MEPVRDYAVEVLRLFRQVLLPGREPRGAQTPSL